MKKEPIDWPWIAFSIGALLIQLAGIYYTTGWIRLSLQIYTILCLVLLIVTIAWILRDYKYSGVKGVPIRIWNAFLLAFGGPPLFLACCVLALLETPVKRVRHTFG